MADIIKIEELREKRLIDRLMDDLGRMNEQAREIANEYYELMLLNPKLAAHEVNQYIERIRNIGTRAYESMCGGPAPEWTGPILNILGLAYPLLEREDRELALSNVMGFLDLLKDTYAQDQVEVIHDPWLVSDIVISRPMYWCGYQEYIKLLKENPTWSEFVKVIPKVKSEFWMALTITRPKHSPFEIRTCFYKAFPDLMDRTLDGIAAIVYHDAKKESEQNNSNIEVSIKNNLAKYDTALHDSILKKTQEKKWIKLGELF